MKITRFQASRQGFTLVEIMIVVAILGLLIAIAVPNFIKTRTNAQKQVCIENLAQIESAKQIWGVEVGRTYGDAPDDSDLIGPTLYIKERPRCPAGGTIRFNAIGTNASCDSPAGHVLQ
jgi:prepilin-type N-terminal cleavage/methylation domain-containing protein